MTNEMPLALLLANFKDGDELGWTVEFDRLWSQDRSMDMLATSIQETGIREPIQLGYDGRVWDGHHRLAVADRLGFETVPVEFVFKVDPDRRLLSIAILKELDNLWVVGSQPVLGKLHARDEILRLIEKGPR